MEQEQELQAAAYCELPEIEDDVTQLNRILAELGSDQSDGAFVSVFRLDKSGRSGEFLDRYDASEFTDGSLLETVRNAWGHGKYQFSVYLPGGGLKTRKVVSIAQRRGEGQGEHVQAARNDGALVEMVRAMSEQHRATMAGLEMIATSLKQNQPAAQSETAILDRLRVMKELFHVEQSGGKEDTARALLEGVKLARELGAGGNGDEPKWLDRVMDKLAGPAMEMMVANANANRKPAATEKPALPASQSELPIPAAMPNNNNQEDEGMLALKLGLKTLLRSARDNDDVAETAERVLLMLPEGDVEQIVKLPNWFEVMCHHEPGCAVHKDWFERLHTELQQQLSAA